MNTGGSYVYGCFKELLETQTKLDLEPLPELTTH